jgi:ABC-type oligopeptide transport system substrate-binding subunit
MSHFLKWTSIPNLEKFNFLKKSLKKNFSTPTSWGTVIRIIVPAFIAATSGCGSQNQGTQSEVVQKIQQSPGYLRLPLKSAIATLDPGLIFDIGQIEVVEQLFLGLTDFNPKTYEVMPELAKDRQVSQNGKVYTFRLRQDIKWSNGESVTAHDLVWAIRRNIVKETDSPYVFTLYPIKNAEAINLGQITDINKLGVRAIDDYTVEFTLNKAAGYFPALASLWTYRPLPRKVIERYGYNWTDPAHIQTNGSYQLTEWNKGDRLILKKNPIYYETEKVNIPEIHYRIVPGDSLALALYKKNEIDIMGGQVYLQLPDKEMSQIKSDPVLRQDRQIRPSFVPSGTALTPNGRQRTIYWFVKPLQRHLTKKT